MPLIEASAELNVEHSFQVGLVVAVFGALMLLYDLDGLLYLQFHCKSGPEIG